MNIRLAYAIDRGKAANLPRENIENAIKRAAESGSGASSVFFSTCVSELPWACQQQAEVQFPNTHVLPVVLGCATADAEETVWYEGRGPGGTAVLVRSWCPMCLFAHYS